MRKYIKPEIAVNRFSVEDIITASGAVLPADASSYKSASDAVAIAGNAYIIDWNSKE